MPPGVDRLCDAGWILGVEAWGKKGVSEEAVTMPTFRRGKRCWSLDGTFSGCCRLQPPRPFCTSARSAEQRQRLTGREDGVLLAYVTSANAPAAPPSWKLFPGDHTKPEDENSHSFTRANSAVSATGGRKNGSQNSLHLSGLFTAFRFSAWCITQEGSCGISSPQLGLRSFFLSAEI